MCKEVIEAATSEETFIVSYGGDRRISGQAIECLSSIEPHARVCVSALLHFVRSQVHSRQSVIEQNTVEVKVSNRIVQVLVSSKD